jgi:L-lactate dehydrogenase complex protein LldE
VSTAMLADKLRRVEESGADAVCACDASCLLHIRGGLERRGSPVRALHLAEILAA